MNHTDLELQALSDPRLAVHAAGSLPAWLWSADGTRVLWTNAIGARAFGAANASALTEKTFGPADQHRRQIAQLARRLPENGTIRLERLRGFGAPLGTLATCGCATIDLPDGTRAVLITSTDTGGRSFPLTERLKRLADNSTTALIAFTQDGQFAGISAAGRGVFGMRDLSEPLFADARNAALADGVAEVQFGAERAILYRIGTASQIGLVAVPLPAPPEETEVASSSLTPDGDAAPAPAPADIATEDATEIPPPASMDAMTERHTDYEAPALSNEAPAEFLLIDDVAEADLFEPLAPGSPSSQGSPGSPGSPTTTDANASEQSPARTSLGHAEPQDSADVTDVVHSAGERRHPLRFTWNMDGMGRFSVGSDEFIRMMGTRTAAHQGRPWHELAASLGLDPDGQVGAAIETRKTWSALVVNWPTDCSERLAVELSGLPVFGEDETYAGYRGFGVCRDLEALERLQRLPGAGSADTGAIDRSMAGGQSDHRTESGDA
ncbi:MAG: PAS domain-containing sensor histidine kinase, partial [Bradyrhizobium sp.]